MGYSKERNKVALAAKYTKLQYKKTEDYHAKTNLESVECEEAWTIKTSIKTKKPGIW